ncbi:MAG TPA: tRNA lysidine(34) synthetase TilS [Candidatus Merdenecus merdavium]|nr:tRNA lysidine(34) synthetase TilS [Candidatus Merdenecus merdavium]
MIGQVFEFVNKYHMIHSGDKVIVGVSGGADSVCLLFVLMELKKDLDFEVMVVHVNHGLRGEESDQDQYFVEHLCKTLDLFCMSVNVSAEDYGKEKGISTEEAGRELRYEAFEQACEKYGGNKIATAHNENDVSETVLLNLIRGSGLRGLKGIDPIRDHIIRPILCLTRDQIENYLENKQISYRTDRTNFEKEYTRNKIRLDVLPYMENHINAKAISHIAHTARHISQAEAYLQRVAHKKSKEIVIEQDPWVIVIDTERLKKEEDIIQQYILRNCVGMVSNQLKDISYHHIESLRMLNDNQVGKKVTLPYGIYGEKGYDTLKIYREKTKSNQQGTNGKSEKREEHKEDTLSVVVPGTYRFQDFCITFSLEDVETAKIQENKYTKWFDYDTMKFGLLVRTRRPKDYLVIDRQGSKKKLKSYMIDEKIPRQLRDGIPLITDGSHILWVIGYRISEEYKVTKSTKNILKIQVDGGNTHGNN